MSGGTSEIHRDSDPLVELSHKGATGASVFVNRTQNLDVFVRVGLYAENVTTGAYGTVSAVREHEIDIAWETTTVGGSDLRMGEDRVIMGDDTPYFVSASEEGEPYWSFGDVLKVYKTAAKDGFISSQWCDRSRGWKTPKDELVDGWREDDLDLNPNGERHVWGPGQPENYRR